LLLLPSLVAAAAAAAAAETALKMTTEIRVLLIMK